MTVDGADFSALLAGSAGAYHGGDMHGALMQARRACECASGAEMPAALFWLATAQDGLGDIEGAAEIWRAVRDHPLADADDPLRSISASYNLLRRSERRERSSQDLDSFANALVTKLASWGGGGDDTLQVISVNALTVLMKGDRPTAVATLANALLLAEASGLYLTPSQQSEARLMDLIANLMLGDHESAELRFEELSEGGQDALSVVQPWAERLRESGDGAYSSMVLLSALLEIGLLRGLGRTEEAKTVGRRALATKAAREEALAPLVGQLKEALE